MKNEVQIGGLFIDEDRVLSHEETHERLKLLGIIILGENSATSESTDLNVQLPENIIREEGQIESPDEFDIQTNNFKRKDNGELVLSEEVLWLKGQIVMKHVFVLATAA